MKYSIITILILIVSISQSVESSGIGWEHIGLKSIKDTLLIEAICTYDTSTILAGESKKGIIYISKNNGISWDTLCQDKYKGTYFSVLKMIDGVIFAGYKSRPVANVMTSVDTGKTWAEHYTTGSSNVYSIEKMMGMYFVGTNHLYLSDAGYSDWQWVPQPEYGSCMMSMANKNDSLYLCSYNGFYLSTDTCETWADVNFTYGGSTTSTGLIGNSIFFTDKNGAYRSDDSFNNHFKKIFSGASYCYSVSDSILIRRQTTPINNDLFYSLDKGDSWTNIPIDLENAEDYGIKSIAANERYIFALSDSGITRLSFDKMLGKVSASPKKLAKENKNIKINGSSINITSTQINGASLKLYSLSGRLLAHKENINLSAGTYQIKSLLNRYFESKGMPSTFILNLKANGAVINKVVVNR